MSPRLRTLALLAPLALLGFAHPAVAQPRPSDVDSQPARDAQPSAPFRPPRLSAITPSTPPPAVQPPPLALPPAPSAPRSVADFRGRAPAGADPREVALSIPRAILYPFHLVTEYGIRMPVRAVLSAGESLHVQAWVTRILHPTPQISWSPAFDIVLGYIPLVGANLTLYDVGVGGNQLSSRFLTGGPHAFDMALQDRIQLGWFRVGLRGSYLDRRDFTFYGLGPLSSSQNRSRYELQRRDVTVLGDFRPSHHFNADASFSYRIDDTGPGYDPSITTVFNTQDPNMVPGFGELALLLTHAGIILDTRTRGEQHTGLRFTANGLLGFDVDDMHQRFLVGDAELQGALEIVRPGRVLAASVYVADSTAFGGPPVPFTYLPSLGYVRHVGFPLGRFTGQSAVLAELRYHYPIWVNLEAVWVVSVGNVFGENFSGFDLGEFTGSAGLGARLKFPGGDAFQAVIGLGSTRFDTAFGVDSVLVTFNLARGL